MTHTTESIKELLNQCEFREALKAIQGMGTPADPNKQTTLLILKSQALFEMHRVKEANEILAQLASTAPRDSESFIYVAGRIAYLDNDYQKAEKDFRLLADRSETVSDYYRALIGLANVFFTTKRHSELLGLLPELEELCLAVPLDSLLSFELLKANIYATVDSQIELAENLLYDVISKASRKRWNYFVIKALYSLAKLAQSQSKRELLVAHLRMLRCYMNPDEAVYLTYLVNEQFKDNDYSIDAPLRFDPDHKRVCVHGDWIPLHDKPLLYSFMEKLFKEGRFVAKEEIAQFLWPDQPYVAKSHDPRIFDIARRVRGLIERYEDQPVCLLSGRYGYKLASTTMQDDKAPSATVIPDKLEKKSFAIKQPESTTTEDLS